MFGTINCLLIADNATSEKPNSIIIGNPTTMYLSLGPCKFDLNFSGMTFTQQPKLDTTLTAIGDNDIVSRKMISDLLPKTEVFNTNNDIQIGGKISEGKKGAVVIGRNSIANGVESIVIGDGV
jgi:hypothetical protein